jgi:CheY-like chemotaxis protein
MAKTAGNLILLVDDDSSARSVRQVVLEIHGHQVVAVGDAEHALRTLQEHPIKLVILDYFLDGMTGTELARMIRGLKPQLPILLLSGSAEVPDGIEHVDDYLSKLEPVSVIEQKIAELLRKQQAPRMSPQHTVDRHDRVPKSGS